MMTDEEENGWSEVAEAAAKMFNIWVDGCELEWARESWVHLYAGGLVGGDTILESTATTLRLLALARIYQEFCGLAWEENPKTPVDYLAEDLEIDPVALGILATSGDADRFVDAEDDYALREAALTAATDRQRAEIFQCLKAAYGGDVQLYSRMSHTRSPATDDGSEGEEFEVTGGNCTALEFVTNGFQSQRNAQRL